MSNYKGIRVLSMGLGPVSPTIFPSQFKFVGNSFHSHLDSNTVIATKFCTWHDSCAVVACAKICCDLMASNGVMARRSFHRIWIVGKKTLVKRAPGELLPQHQWVLSNLAKRIASTMKTQQNRIHIIKVILHISINLSTINLNMSMYT